jgi:hypothetical protein
MRPITESDLQNSLDSRSTKRLDNLRNELKRGDDRRIYDDRAVEMLKAYVFNQGALENVLQYLKHLTDNDGIPFSRSYYNYQLYQESWVGFCGPEVASFRWNEHYQAAVERVIDRYSIAHLAPLSYHSDSDIFDAVTDWDTSAGWTKIISGSSHKRDYLDGIFDHWSAISQQALEIGSYNCPIIPGKRTQCSGAFDEDGNESHTCKHKNRAINMVDIMVIISERKWAKPLTQWISTYPYSAVGKPDEWICNWVFTQRMQRRSYISLDYSKYDSTIPSWLIRSAFDVIRSAFNDCDSNLLNVLEEDFINKNIITGDSIIFTNHGNPSGSGFTTIINGICNEIITETWMHAFGLSGHYNIMGDDNLIYLDYSFPSDLVHRIASYIKHNFGVVVNPDKSSYGTPKDYPEYLSRFWTEAGGRRDFGEVISLLAYPESFRPYDEYDDLTPQLVIYSYILAYPVTMRKNMDVDRFIRDTGLREESIQWTKKTRQQIPYNVRTYVESKQKLIA